MFSVPEKRCICYWNGSETTSFIGSGDEGNNDSCAKKCKLFQPTGLALESDNAIYVVEFQSYCVKIFTTLGKTGKFLETIGNLYKAFSVHEKKGDYELQSSESACVLVDESFKSLKLFQTNFRNHLQKPCKSLDGRHGFISLTSLLSSEMIKWSLGRLRNLFTEFSSEINLVSMMNLNVEHFHTTSYLNMRLISQLKYSILFTTTVKQSFKRNSHWSSCYFTNGPLITLLITNAVDSERMCF